MLHGMDLGKFDVYKEINLIENGKGLVYEVFQYMEMTKQIDDLVERAPQVMEIIRDELQDQTYYDQKFGFQLLSVYKQCMAINTGDFVEVVCCELLDIIYDFILQYASHDEVDSTN